MKSVGRSIALIAVFSMCCSHAGAQVFSINSARILQESREGRSVLMNNEKEKKEVMDLEYKESQKIVKLRDEIETGMRSGKLPQAKMQEKYIALNRQQRMSKQVVENAREDFKVKEQQRVMKFRTKVHSVANDFFKRKGGTMVFDRSVPGLIFVADSTDKTDELLKELNLRHEKEKAKLALTKGNSKKA